MPRGSSLIEFFVKAPSKSARKSLGHRGFVRARGLNILCAAAPSAPLASRSRARRVAEIPNECSPPLDSPVQDRRESVIIRFGTENIASIRLWSIQWTTETMKKAKRRRKRQQWRLRQIEGLTDEINKCLIAEFWHAALVLTLILPDICVSLELSKGNSNGHLYEQWCEKWLANEYRSLAKDLYYLRCGLAHEATSQHRNIKSKRIFFALGSKDAHMQEHKEAFTLDLNTFAGDMTDAVKAWYAKQAQNPNVQKKIGAIIQYYPSLDFLSGPAIG